MSPAPALNGEEARRVAEFEAAPELPEAFETTERVMRAIYEAAEGYMAGVPWERARTNPFKEAKAHRQACAAIDALDSALAARRPATEAEEVVERVRALAEEDERAGAEAEEAQATFRRQDEAWDYYRRVISIKRASAARIRAALGAAADGGGLRENDLAGECPRCLRRICVCPCRCGCEDPS